MMKSLQGLMESLINATSSNKIQWEEKSPDTYKVSISDYYVKVFEWIDPEDGTSGVCASLHNSEDKEIDNFVAGEYDSNIVPLRKLFDLARRNANGVDEAISELENELGRLL